MKDYSDKTFFMAATKELKIQPKQSSRTYGSKTVPEINLKGLWLEAVGFKAGSKVVIEVREGELIIKPV